VRGWLVVVTRRLCLDQLDVAETRRATATAEPPEPPGGIPDPADRVMLHDEVGQALSVVVGRLSPAERTSFILHDVFGFPFDAVAGFVGRTPAACRQLARRARLSVGAGSSRAELASAFAGSTEAAGLAERFIAVCEGGDVHGLIGLLDPEVAGFPMVIGLGVRPGVRGAEAVAGRAMHFSGPPLAFPSSPSTSRGGLRWSSAGAGRSWRWSAWMTVRAGSFTCTYWRARSWPAEPLLLSHSWRLSRRCMT
jgi:RNA polymerase sigma-70 factor (ECF subfamily)